MKKILLSLLLIVTMIFSLTSCDKIVSSLTEKYPELALGILYVKTLITDGSHQWGMWQIANAPNNCEDITLVRFCSDCDATQIMRSKKEHNLVDHYSFDKSYHWYDCLACDHSNHKEKHTYHNDVCTTCGYTETPTKGIVYDALGKTYASVINYTGDDAFVVISNEFDGLPVTRIEGMGFGDWIEVVVIPDSVTIIDDLAFRNFSQLTRIVIPDSVVTIGDEAFANCDSLQNIVIGDGVTSIGNFAFYSCSNLSSIEIGDSVTTIGYRAFAFNQNLTRVVLPKSVTSIGDMAFQECKNLTDIYYTGTKEEWQQIDKGAYMFPHSNNNNNSITIHFNYVPEE